MSFWTKLRSVMGGFPWGTDPFQPFGGGQPLPGLEAGAGRRRLATFVPASEHINTLLRNAGDTTLARARYLVRNNGYAKAALRSWTTATVGAGIKPFSRIEDLGLRRTVMQLFADWTDEADYEGVADFYAIQRRVTRECFLAGECFVIMRPRSTDDMATVPLQLQVLPSEQLPYWRSETAPNGNPIRLGVEFNRAGRRVAYWFWRDNPTDTTLTFANALAYDALERVPAETVLHVYDPVEAGQIRGLSHYAPAVVKMFMHDIYDDAELERKKQAARYATFITRPPPQVGDDEDSETPGLIPGEGTFDPYYGPGATMMLAEGDDVKFSQPADVGPNYEGFQYRTLLQVCAGLGVPYSEMSSDLSKTSYASSRAGLLAFRGDVEAFQYAVLVFQFLRPVYQQWLATAVLAGGVPISAQQWNRERAQLVRFQAIPPKTPWVDPLKDRSAEEIAVRNGWKSRSQVIEAEGFDVEEVNEMIAADREREAELGLDFTIPLKGAGGGMGSSSGQVPTVTTGENRAVSQEQGQAA